MRCPRCKGENDENSIECSNCGLKLKTVCPRCKSYNKIGQASCANCKLMLIRFCPQCKTPNFPNAQTCRKCSFVLRKPKQVPAQQTPQAPSEIQTINPSVSTIQPQTVNTGAAAQQSVSAVTTPLSQNNPPQTEIIQQNTVQAKPEKDSLPLHADFLKKTGKDLSRTEATNQILKLCKNSKQGMIIGLSAPDGGGKSTLISSIPQFLKEDGFVWLIGNCQPDNQLVPYSFFRDMFKTLFSLPLFITNVQESSNALRKILETSLAIKEPFIINILERIILNDFSNCSEDIFENNSQIHNAVFQFFTLLNQKSNFVLIIEDFEYIDKASQECLKNLLTKGIVDKKNFVFINHRPDINLHDEFSMESLKNKIFSITLTPISPEEFNKSLTGMLNGQDIIPQKLKNKIFQLSQETPIYIEQILWLFFQTGAIIQKENLLHFNPKAENIELPPTIEELIKTRLKLIENASSDSMKIVMSACITGVKFVPSLIKQMIQIEDQQFDQLVQMLVNNGILAISDQFNVKFKHNLIWRVIYEQNCTEEQIANSAKIVLDCYAKYPGAVNNSILLRHADEANLNKEIFLFVDLAAKESVYFGDPSTYTEYQTRLLEMLPEIDYPDEQKEYIKNTIEEQLGKANYLYNPTLAMDYLANAILFAEKQSDVVKTIDLTGYMAKSCELSGNFAGAIECCEKALSYVDKNKYQLETILLNYYKLESVFNLGRLEEAIISATNEVLPQLNKFIAKNKTIAGINTVELKNIEYEIELTLAKAYVFQGNKKALDLLDNIIAKAQKENLTDFEVHARLLYALFNVIQGNRKKCNSIIEIVNQKISDIAKPEKLKLLWYFITILATFIDGNFQQTKELCYTGLKLATLLKEYNTLNLINLVLGKCYEELNQPKLAVLLYNEAVNYCSENKMATGALFSWFLAASLEYSDGHSDRAMEIADRAFEISHKPNISNNITAILLSKLISQVRTQKGDCEGAQINIEHGIGIAEENNLFMFLAELYAVFAEIYTQNAASNDANATNNANIANRLNAKALFYAKQTENDYIISIVESKISKFVGFCKQSGIKLENIA